MFLRVVVLVSLVKLLNATDKPFLCAGLYTLFIFLFGLLWVFAGSASFLALLIATVIRFGLSSLYFWLLYKAEEGFLWWVVFVLGIFIGLV
jgi:hypothetical protein